MIRNRDASDGFVNSLPSRESNWTHLKKVVLPQPLVGDDIPRYGKTENSS
jgi:hypothetical protein